MTAVPDAFARYPWQVQRRIALQVLAQKVARQRAAREQRARLAEREAAEVAATHAEAGRILRRLNADPALILEARRLELSAAFEAVTPDDPETCAERRHELAAASLWHIRHCRCMAQGGASA